MKIKVLLNPYANRWRAQRQAPAVKAAFRDAGYHVDLAILPAAGQGATAAMAAVEDGFDMIVAAGGDGTVSEVVNGLITVAGDRPTVPLGIIPLGTGNDFNDMNRLPRDMVSSVQTIINGKTRQVDAGQVEIDGVSHFFDNNCALAMEPLVTLENIRMKKLSGNIRYIVALAKALLHLHAWHMRLTWHNGEFEGPVYLFSVCNSPRNGGMFYMAPEANLTDGLLDYVLAPEVSKATVMLLVIRLFRGTHISHPKVSYGRSDQIVIESEPGTPIHADGELIAESAKQIIYRALPGKITLLST